MAHNSTKNFFTVQNSSQTCTGFDPTKIYMLGEKNSGLKPRGIIQNYTQIKTYHLQNQTLFEDTQFSPETIQLGDYWSEKKSSIQWLRPKEITANARFIREGKDRFDVNQGALGDCWFLAALADVSQNYKLIELIVPPEQSLLHEYAGIFHFRFWQYGRWIDVVVDDRLPTSDGKLIYLKSNRPDEFWTPLLEKAYAKLYGSYKNLQGGLTSEALQDFTGGLTEIYEEILKLNHTYNFFDMMEVSYKKQSFMGCAITNTNEMEAEVTNGLYSRHAYSITAVVRVSDRAGDNNFKLIRLRNPWGECEWKGNWSDNSHSWDLVSEDIKHHLLRVKDDGEFWMEFGDFVTNYTLLEFCHPNPDSLKVVEKEMQHWKSFMIDGGWVARVTNGGLPKDKNFYRNPQYLLSINGAGAEKETTYRVIIGLMQKNRRIHGLPELPIGFAIYRVINSVLGNGRLGRDFLSSRKPVYWHQVEVSKQATGHVELSNGSYCIIPFTEESNISCEFLLRVYSEAPFTLKENDEEVGIILQENVPSKPVDTTAADTAIEEVFKSFAGNDEQISWAELKNILDLLLKGEKQEFSKEVCRSMVALMDTDQSGKLNFHEFFQLWEKIGIWRGTFRSYDVDQSNTISGPELREALRASKIRVNNRILNMLMLRYANAKGVMEMEDFLHCCIKLTSMIEMYESGNYSGKRTDWIIDTIYT